MESDQDSVDSHASSQLGENRLDRLASALKLTAGYLPVVGPVIAEVAGTIIPDQRIDRVVRFVELLEERVNRVEQAAFDERVKQKDAVDLVEETMVQAARATSEERLAYLAGIAGRGVTEDEISLAGQLARTLDRLSDIEVLRLRRALPRYAVEEIADREFIEKHGVTLEPPTVYIGSDDSVQLAFELYRSHLSHLEQEGLLVRQNEQWNSHRVTHYGRIFLDWIGMYPDWARDELPRNGNSD